MRCTPIVLALSVLGGFVPGCAGAQSSPASPAVTVGAPAPAFMLQSHEGRVRTLEENRGHPVVLYFYPRDATPGCTREACAFRDAWARLQATGAVVYGVSTDDVASHRSFHEEHQLPFDLLSDPDGAIAQTYGVPMRLGMTARVTFLIDASGNLARVFEDVDPAVHADEVIAAIEALPSAAP